MESEVPFSRASTRPEDYQQQGFSGDRLLRIQKVRGTGSHRPVPRLRRSQTRQKDAAREFYRTGRAKTVGKENDNMTAVRQPIPVTWRCRDQQAGKTCSTRNSPWPPGKYPGSPGSYPYRRTYAGVGECNSDCERTELPSEDPRGEIAVQR
jgi:hypothetical protein